MDYLLIKKIHVILVFTSIGFFTLRFYWSIVQSSLLKHRINRTLPHLIDTLLLSAGIYLMMLTKFWPSEHAWLAVKLLCLLLYILLGSFAIKHGRTKRIRICCGTMAIGVFAYMVSVAYFKAPLWFLELSFL